MARNLTKAKKNAMTSKLKVPQKGIQTNDGGCRHMDILTGGWIDTWMRQHAWIIFWEAKYTQCQLFVGDCRHSLQQHVRPKTTR